MNIGLRGKLSDDIDIEILNVVVYDSNGAIERPHYASVGVTHCIRHQCTRGGELRFIWGLFLSYKSSHLQYLSFHVVFNPNPYLLRPEEGG